MKKIIQEVIFSARPICGLFRFKNEFQILPLPEKYPRPDYLVAMHPILIQIPFESNETFPKYDFERSKVIMSTVRKINSLLRQHFHYSYYDQVPSWGMGNISHAIELFNHSYCEIKDLDSTDLVIPLYDLPDIQRIDFDEYYTSHKTFSPNEIVLPINFVEMLGYVNELNDTPLKVFNLASAYFDKAYSVWSKSSSASFIFYISGLESLMEQPEKCNGAEGCNQIIASSVENGSICKKCKQPKLRVNARFKAFLTEFGVSDNFKNIKNDLYTFRSDMAHGKFLMYHDIEPWNFNENFEEGQRHRFLHQICKIVLYNWLIKQHTKKPVNNTAIP